MSNTREEKQAAVAHWALIMAAPLPKTDAEEVEDIIGELVGQEMLSEQSAETERLKNAIRSKTARIRSGIEKQENGRWAEDRAGPYKVFRFIQSSGLSKYEERGLQE